MLALRLAEESLRPAPLRLRPVVAPFVVDPFAPLGVAAANVGVAEAVRIRLVVLEEVAAPAGLLAALDDTNTGEVTADSGDGTGEPTRFYPRPVTTPDEDGPTPTNVDAWCDMGAPAPPVTVACGSSSAGESRRAVSPGEIPTDVLRFIARGEAEPRIWEGLGPPLFTVMT
jgi:hypothetical protein